MLSRLNAYRIMWVLVMYDLPMVNEADKRRYAHFRKTLLKDGFQKFQFSMYVRHCSSKESAEVHVKRVRSMLPSKGDIGIMQITDRQFGMIEIFHGKETAKRPEIVRQLELF